MKIILKTAVNGVIKEIPENEDYTEVYEEMPDKQHVIRFLYELCEDLDLDIGSKFDKEVVKFHTDWGSHYEPSIEEIEERIMKLKEEIDIMEEMNRQ